MTHIEIIGRDGRRRRARKGEVLADGEKFSMPVQFMDGAVRRALKENFGWCDHQPPQGGFRRGYHFDVASPPRHVKDAADAAYEERRKYLQNAWRCRTEDATDNDALLPTQDARAVADQAYRDKCERLQSAWRLK